MYALDMLFSYSGTLLAHFNKIISFKIVQFTVQALSLPNSPDFQQKKKKEEEERKIRDKKEKHWDKL